MSLDTTSPLSPEMAEAGVFSPAVLPVPAGRGTRPAHRTRRRRSLPGLIWEGVETVMAIVAVVVGTLAVVIAVASHFSSEGQYTVFGHPVLIVLSGSMSPTIRTGDLIYDDQVSSTEASHLQAGQIITFRSPPGSKVTFTHRINAVEHVDGTVAYRTKGDANDAPDASLVFPSQVVGVYRGKVPYGGFVLNSLHKPVALLLILASPCLWLLSNVLFRMARRTEEDGPQPTSAPAGEAAPI